MTNTKFKVGDRVKHLKDGSVWFVNRVDYVSDGFSNTLQMIELTGLIGWWLSSAFKSMELDIQDRAAAAMADIIARSYEFTHVNKYDIHSCIAKSDQSIKIFPRDIITSLNEKGFKIVEDKT